MEIPTNKELAEQLGVTENEVGGYRLDSVFEHDSWRISFAIESPPALRDKLDHQLTFVVPVRPE
ncbi:hypothetical protein D3C78_354940 [compost metagenome]